MSHGSGGKLWIATNVVEAASVLDLSVSSFVAIGLSCKRPRQQTCPNIPDSRPRQVGQVRGAHSSRTATSGAASVVVVLQKARMAADTQVLRPSQSLPRILASLSIGYN